MLRVISLLPSAAEIICLVAGPEVLVGRSHEDDFPTSITHLPVLTRAKTVFTNSEDVNRQVSESLAQGNSLYELDVEQLKALKPDVIVTQDLCDVCSIDLVTVERVVKDMSPAPKVVTLNPQSLSDVLESVTLVGSALSLDEAAARVRAELQGRIDAATRVASEGLFKRGGKRPAVAFAEWIDPFFVGGHWTPQIIELAGGAHPLNPSKDQSGAGKSFAIPPSRVLAQPTDILIICPCGLDIPTVERELDVLTTKARDKGEPNWWEVMREECKVAIVDGNQMFNRPGPRLVDALEWLTGLFNDVPEIIPRDFPYKLTGENAKDESAVLAREMKSLDAELAWLLTIDLPPTLANICTELTRCVKASASGAQDPNTKPGTLALSSVNNDSLKGYITINSSQIVKGELTIKLPNYNRGNPFKTNLVASKPYPLDQAQHAKNYTLLALKALESYTQPYSKQDAVEATDILLKYVNWARSALTHASVEKLFPYKVCDSSLFTPELPDDLVVEFFISDAFVVCSISALQYHASMPTTSAVAKLLGGPKPVNKVVKYKDKYVVIVDEIVIDSKSPTLVDMLAALKSVEDACRQFRTKLSLFL